jgi:uncharacterized protein (TIGR03118 family)
MRFADQGLRRLLKRGSFGRKAPFIHPRLEALEDRLTLSTGFLQTNLVSDIPGLAQVTNANSVNAWGLTASATSPFWISNQGTGTSTLYNTSKPQVQVLPLVVSIPPNPADNPLPAHGSPTGDVFNIAGSGFNVTANGKSAPSIFMFATTDGTISGWAPSVDGTHAIIGATSPGAVYTGLAIATSSSGDTLLYAANFARNTIDVFNSSFKSMTLTGSFTDSELPRDYRVFNVQAINNQLYVEYAPFDPTTGGVAPGHDNGAVDVFNTDGQLQQRLIRHGHLDDPWGIAMAPANFGRFSNDLLVGNFGEGTINAFDPNNGHFEGELRDPNGQPITIEHLWALRFGNGAASGPTDTLFFTAGLTSHFGGTSNLPPHGLFGSLQVVPGADDDMNDDNGDGNQDMDDESSMTSMMSASLATNQGAGDQQIVTLAPSSDGHRKHDLALEASS